jgi:hypothetical protein
MSAFRTATLYELDDQGKNKKENGKTAVIQFNPESLKVTYANQIVDPPAGSGSQSDGTSSRQFVGAGTTKLSLQIWFDIGSPMPGQEKPVDDVRRLTQQVTGLMRPEPSNGDKKICIPPIVRFEWGSFKFDGIIDALDETLDYFSENGTPLRASMTLSMSKQEILIVNMDGGAGWKRPSAGTQPMTAAAQGSTVQGMAEAAGKGGDWQRIAQANGIENPRRPALGQLIDLGPRSGRGGV